VQGERQKEKGKRKKQKRSFVFMIERLKGSRAQACKGEWRKGVAAKTDDLVNN